MLEEVEGVGEEARKEDTVKIRLNGWLNEGDQIQKDHTDSIKLGSRNLKRRQAIILVMLPICLALTILTCVYGGTWTALVVASYVLFGGILIYGNKKMYLVKFSPDDGE